MLKPWQIGRRQADSQSTGSKKMRNLSPMVSEADLATLVANNGTFAFDLYRKIKNLKTNLFFSPYSISGALAMAFAGSRGDTEKEMAHALKYNLSQDNLHEAFSRLDLRLKERYQRAKAKDTEAFTLNGVNNIWGQKGYDFLAQFLDVLAEDYGGGLRLLDFATGPEQSRTEINQWISDQTGGKIRDLVPRGVIDQLTKLVLTNAIYFKASWEFPFNRDLTGEGIFHLSGGIDISVPMMQQSKPLGYAEGYDYQVVELPYEGGQFSMVIWLPGIEQFDIFAEKLDAGLIKASLEGLSTQQVKLTLPKFGYNFGFSLKESLAELGMVRAFTGEADFSGMNGKHDLLIKDVLHKAFISVDEAGTEAAAATAVIMQPKSMPLLATEMKVERPFIFLIREIPTDSILFLGQVLDPAKC